MKKASKLPKPKWIDDGRVIASMESVEPSHGAPLGRPRRRKGSFDPFGQIAEKKEPVALSGKERRSIVFGVLVAHSALLLVVLGLAIIAFLLMPLG